jgi:hypothetical protein
MSNRRFDREQKQISTISITVQEIMETSEFARGFEDARAGIAFDWRIGSATNHSWSYERGRQFAHIAPITMALRINGKLNRKALLLCSAAFAREIIL